MLNETESTIDFNTSTSKLMDIISSYLKSAPTPVFDHPNHSDIDTPLDFVVVITLICFMLLFVAIACSLCIYRGAREHYPGGGGGDDSCC